MEWIYLSPHLDDVALSCGGLVWEQAHAGQHVEIWTLCAGDAPSGPISVFAETLHQRWGTGGDAAGQRRAEDRASCRILGADCLQMDLPDCIYRKAGEDVFLYDSEEAIFGPLHPAEEVLVQSLTQQLELALSSRPQARLVCPLALGGHVDHRLTRAVVEHLGQPAWYYADYPYVLQEPSLEEHLHHEGWCEKVFPISAEGLRAWQQGVEAHASQISSFWLDLSSMEAAICSYSQSIGGARLWHLS